ncbi:unnamed protein product [Merluccius merluccius]
MEVPGSDSGRPLGQHNTPIPHHLTLTPSLPPSHHAKPSEPGAATSLIVSKRCSTPHSSFDSCLDVRRIAFHAGGAKGADGAGAGAGSGARSLRHRQRPG